MPVPTTPLAALPAKTVPAIIAAAAHRGYDWEPADVRAIVRVRPAGGRWLRRREPRARDLADVAERVVAAGARYLVWCDRHADGSYAGFVVRYDATSVRDTSVAAPTAHARSRVGGIALHGDLGPLGRTHTITIGDSQPAVDFRETVLVLAGRIIEV